MSENSETPDNQEGGFSFPDLPIRATEVEKFDLDALHEFLAGLDRWADDMMKGADQEAQSIEQIYHSRLPGALFHATTRAGAEQIKKEGLKPSPLQFENNKVVSLSDSIRYAKFCASETQGVPPEELVVLEVTTQGLDREDAKSFLLLDNPLIRGEKLHEVHYGKPINPDWIYELSPHEIVDIERNEF